MNKVILAGDIGGTKTSVGLYDAETMAPDGRSAPAPLHQGSYPSSEHSGLSDVIELFLKQSGHGERAILASCFGVAGPVLGNRSETPNLPWVVDGNALAERFGIPKVALVNDLVATGKGIPALLPDEFEEINGGSPSEAPGQSRALLAPGTGLGMSILVPTADGGFEPRPSEGGHMSFAPRNDQEIGLLRFMQERLAGRVSIERLAAGPGLPAIYEYLLAGDNATPNAHARKVIEEDQAEAPKVITEHALAGSCVLCEKTLELFVRLLGAIAGDLALAALATAGVYLGGGIPPKILPKLRGGVFMETFTAKGRFQSLLEAIPVRVILNADAALFGAARHAMSLT